MRTFKQSYDLLTESYISGKVDPWNCKACFCGNLLRGTSDWTDARRDGLALLVSGKSELNPDIKQDTIKSITENSEGTYTPKEIAELEAKFLSTIYRSGGSVHAFRGACVPREIDEEALFKAFEATLELLREIHEQHGENIEEQFIQKFEKRKINDRRIICAD